MPIATIEWIGGIDGKIKIIDQTLLPNELKYVFCNDLKEIYHAIKTLMVRGAPAIGIAAAMGTVLGIGKKNSKNFEEFIKDLKETTSYLASSRPTAVNLFWALKRMEDTALKNSDKPIEEIKNILLDEAKTILEEDKEICRKIGENGQSLIKEGDSVLTHCNAGGLATGYFGTALALIFAATEKGKTVHVYADETRPLLQGSRLTAWELKNAGIDVTLICDNMAAHTMREKKVDCVIVGADKEIPIEERDPEEVTHIQGKRIAPDNIKVYNPAFDVTPAENIKAIITENGIINDPNTEKVRSVIQRIQE